MFIRQGLITRRLPKFETKVSETICVELTISKKKWCILFAYRPPQNNNLKTFLEDINLSLSTTVKLYDNIMLIGHLNLNTKSKNNSFYSNSCDTFDMTNLIKANTCFKSSNQTSIDVTLTNQPRSFQRSGVITTGLSNCHKMILTFFCSYFSRLQPKNITYRSFRYFEAKDFLYELGTNLRTKEFHGGVKNDDLTNALRSLLDSHTPLKKSK